MKNKIIAHLTIILILVGVFCNVCTTYNRISVYDNSVYAEADNWTSCDSSDLVTAFRYYCKSRNLAIDGSMADALTTFTTTTFNNICSTLGIDTTTLQAELKKTTQGNLGLRFLFSQTGITAYNRIFAEFLQNNNLAVGDEVDNEVVYSAESYTDDDGNNCIVWEIRSNQSDPSWSTNDIPKSYILKYGSYLKYQPDDYVSLINGGTTSVTFNIDNSIKNVSIGLYNYNQGKSYCINQNQYYSFRQFTKQGVQTKCIGGIGVAKVYNDSQNRSIYALVMISLNTAYYNFDNSNVDDRHNGFAVLKTLTDRTDDVNVTVNTPSGTTINNNTYNNNYVIIYNDGDTYISDDDEEPLPTTPPDGGGGGGGGDNPDNPDIPPVDPTPTPNPTIPDWDIELPEMPTGNDWLLYGLEKKFPWDIPYNLMYMLSLFAADPETPHFEGTLDLKIVQWNYDIDLAPFDDIAGYVRNIEFIGFLIGLMLLTNKLIWG